jgi:hypothetical protein
MSLHSVHRGPIDRHVFSQAQLRARGDRPPDLIGWNRATEAKLGEAFRGQRVAASSEQRDGLPNPIRRGCRSSRDQADQRAPPNSPERSLGGIRGRVTIWVIIATCTSSFNDESRWPPMDTSESPLQPTSWRAHTRRAMLSDGQAPRLKEDGRGSEGYGPSIPGSQSQPDVLSQSPFGAEAPDHQPEEAVRIHGDVRAPAGCFGGPNAARA